MNKNKVGPFSVGAGGSIVDSHEEIIDGQKIHVIDSFELFEVSLVHDPADPRCVVYRPSWLRRNWPYLIPVILFLLALAAMYFVLRIT